MKTRLPSVTTVMVIFWNLGMGGVQQKMMDFSWVAAQEPSPEIWFHYVLRDRPKFRLDREINLKQTVLHYRPGIQNGIFHMPFSLFVLWQAYILRPAVLLAFLDHASFLAILSAKILFWRRIRVVLNEDTFTSQFTTSWLKRKFISALYPCADIIMSPTNASKKDLVRIFRIPSEKITIMPNWTLQKEQKPMVRKYDFLYIGRFAKQKNLFFLLDVLSDLIKYDASISLCLVGDGPEKNVLINEVRARHLSRNVTIRPPSNQISSYMRQSRIFVLSSHYEGMPVALLEAMAMGLPVISRSYPGISEYLTHGKTGLIARTKREFVHHARYLLDHPRTRAAFQKRGIRDIRNRFSYNTLQKYIETMLQNS